MGLIVFVIGPFLHHPRGLGGLGLRVSSFRGSRALGLQGLGRLGFGFRVEGVRV